MGEANRRKQKDPSYGKSTRDRYLTDTYNLWRIEEQDGDTWLITNLELEQKGFREFPTDWQDAVERHLQVDLGVSKPSKQCWVLIPEEVCSGEVVLGRLSHHPAQAFTKGFATLAIERRVKTLAA